MTFITLNQALCCLDNWGQYTNPVWELYRNELYGFEFSYPSMIKLHEFSTKDTYTIFFNSPALEKFQMKGMHVYPPDPVESEQIVIHLFLDKPLDEELNQYPQELLVNEITVAGYPAKEFTISGEDIHSRDVVFQRDNVVIRFSVGVYQTKELGRYFDQILSTFRFVR